MVTQATNPTPHHPLTPCCSVIAPSPCTATRWCCCAEPCLWSHKPPYADTVSIHTPPHQSYSYRWVSPLCFSVLTLVRTSIFPSSHCDYHCMSHPPTHLLTHLPTQPPTTPPTHSPILSKPRKVTDHEHDNHHHRNLYNHPTNVVGSSAKDGRDEGGSAGTNTNTDSDSSARNVGVEVGVGVRVVRVVIVTRNTTYPDTVPTRYYYS